MRVSLQIVTNDVAMNRKSSLSFDQRLIYKKTSFGWSFRHLWNGNVTGCGFAMLKQRSHFIFHADGIP